MIVNHCVSLLDKGVSAVAPLTLVDRTCFKLQSGVSTKRLDGLKTALMMIEVMNVQQDGSSPEQQIARLEHFASYVRENFPVHVVMALAKFALRDRNIKKIGMSPGWKTVLKSFKPVILDNSQNPQELKRYKAAERLYAKLVSHMQFSVVVNSFLSSELETMH